VTLSYPASTPSATHHPPVDAVVCTQDLRLRHLAQRLHALGERPLYEFLREVAAGADLIARLECYAKLDPDIVASLGGDRFAGLFAIAGGGR
jgi:hypothetical protein